MQGHCWVNLREKSQPLYLTGAIHRHVAIKWEMFRTANLRSEFMHPGQHKYRGLASMLFWLEVMDPQTENSYELVSCKDRHYISDVRRVRSLSAMKRLCHSNTWDDPCCVSPAILSHTATNIKTGTAVCLPWEKYK
jgi:hypothetical protein